MAAPAKKKKPGKGQRGARQKTKAKPAKLLPGEVRTQREVGQVFDVSVRTVRAWVAEGMPRNDSGTYSLADIGTWRGSRNGKANGGTANPDKDDADLRFRKAKSRKMEVELGVLEGNYVLRKDMEKRARAQALVLRKKLLAFQKTLPPVLVGMSVRDIQAEIKERVYDILRSFAHDASPEEAEKIAKA